MNLDIGCSDKKREGFKGMDKRNILGVDYVHDIESVPWPIETCSVYAVNASHVLEHIKPWLIIDVMNEAWRVARNGGGMDIRTPFGLAYSLDPTHTICFNALSWNYFDPSKKSYDVYKPKPWKILSCDVIQGTQEIRTILQKDDK